MTLETVAFHTGYAFLYFGDSSKTARATIFQPNTPTLGAIKILLGADQRANEPPGLWACRYQSHLIISVQDKETVVIRHTPKLI